MNAKTVKMLSRIAGGNNSNLNRLKELWAAADSKQRFQLRQEMTARLAERDIAKAAQIVKEELAVANQGMRQLAASSSSDPSSIEDYEDSAFTQ